MLAKLHFLQFTELFLAITKIYFLSEVQKNKTKNARINKRQISGHILHYFFYPEMTQNEYVFKKLTFMNVKLQ